MLNTPLHPPSSTPTSTSTPLHWCQGAVQGRLGSERELVHRSSGALAPVPGLEQERLFRMGKAGSGWAVQVRVTVTTCRRHLLAPAGLPGRTRPQASEQIIWAPYPEAEGGGHGGAAVTAGHFLLWPLGCRAALNQISCHHQPLDTFTLGTAVLWRFIIKTTVHNENIFYFHFTLEMFLFFFIVF